MFLRLAIIILLSSFSLAQAKQKIGVLDLKKIISESLVMKNINDQLIEQQSYYQKYIDSEEKKFKEEVTKIENKKAILSKEALAKEEKELLKKISELSNDVKKKQNLLTSKAKEASEKIIEKIKIIGSEIAKKDKIDLIIISEYVIFHKDNLDVSQKVLEKLDESFSSINIEFNN